MIQNDTTPVTPVATAESTLQWQVPICTEIEYSATETGPPPGGAFDALATST